MNTLTWECKSFDELNITELYRLLCLRQEVFVVEQNCPYLDTDDKDQSAWHLCGYDVDGDLVAYSRLLPKGVSYENYPAIGRVVTSSKIRGKGLGGELMSMSIEHTKKLFGAYSIKISAQNHLRKFYGSLGFNPVGEVYDEDGIPHISMVLKV